MMRGSNRLVKRNLAVSVLMAMTCGLGVAVPAYAETPAADTGRKYAVIMNDADVTLSNYSGKDVYFWRHEAGTPSDLKGGRLIIQNAQRQKSGDLASITLVTDSSGMTLSDESAVRNVLQKLGDKLTYTAYTTGERNLEGTVEIYEGLTFASASQKVSTLTFNETTGKGEVTGQIHTPFTEVLRGGVLDDTSEYKKRGVVQADGTYKFTEDTVIHPGFNISSQSIADQASVNIRTDTVIDMTGHKLSAYMFGNLSSSSATPRSCGLYVPTASTLTINNPGAIDLFVDSTYYYYAGVGVMSKDSHLIINNDSNPEHRVKIRQDTPNYTVNMTGLKTFDGTIDIKGLVDIYINGAWATNAAGGRISVGGGRLQSDNYPAVTARSGGIMNVNVSGSVQEGLVPGNNPVTIKGDLSTKGYYVGTNDGATVNVALTTEDSSFTGKAQDIDVIDPHSPMGMRLFLQNGAKWYNTGSSFLKQLYGGKKYENAGVINQKENKLGEDIVLSSYTGHMRVFYGHDKTNPAMLDKGNIYIQSAEIIDGERPSVTMMTDSEGFGDKIHDTSYTGGILQSLAQKLVYTGYKNGERNLDAYVGIAEGVTSPSFMERRDVLFSDTNGRGYISGYEQKKTEFTTTLTGIMSENKEYAEANVLKAEDTPVFSKDSSITVVDADAIRPEIGHQMSLSFGNLNLSVDGKTNQAAGIRLRGQEMGITGDGIISVKGKGKSAGILVKKEGDTLGKLKVGSQAGFDISASDVGILSSGHTGEGYQTKKTTVTFESGESRVKIQSTDKNNKDFVGLKSEDGGTFIAKHAVEVDAGAGIALDGNGTFYGGKFVSHGNVAVRVGGTAGKYASNQSPLMLYSSNPDEKSKTRWNLTIDAGKGIAVDAEAGHVQIGGRRNWSREIIGEVYITGNIRHKQGASLILDGEGSFWKGSTIAVKDAPMTGFNQRSMNLTMVNGARWYHEYEGEETDPAKVSLFTGGQLVTGVNGTPVSIYQRSDRPIQVSWVQNAYNGQVLQVFYDHKKDKPEEMIGGDIELKSTPKGTNLLAITGSEGIDRNNSAQVAAVLDALAHKVVYSGLIGAASNGTLDSAKVKIAESLTSPDVTVSEGHMNFDDKGRGFYVQPKGNIFTAPVSDDTKKSQVYKDNGVWVYCGAGSEWNAPITAAYQFAGDASVKSDYAIDLVTEKLGGLGVRYRIGAGGHTVTFEGEKAALHTAGNATKSNSGRGTIYFHDITANLVPGENGRRSLLSEGISMRVEAGENASISIHDRKGADPKTYVAVEARGASGVGIATPVRIMAQQGTAFLISDGAQNVSSNQAETVVDATGGYLLRVENNQGNGAWAQLSGKLLAGDVDLRKAKEGFSASISPSSDTNGVFRGAFLADKTQENEKDRLATGSVSVRGSVAIKGNFSTWEYMWQNVDQAQKCYVNKVSGDTGMGPGTGTVYIKDSHDLQIGNLSGTIRFYYDHAADQPEQIKGGNIYIDKANKKNTYVTIRTDGAGIDIKKESQVSKVLDALAHKLFFTGYKENNDENGHIDGTVEIAEGLTSISAKKTGTIGFKQGTGQGYLVTDSVVTPSQTETLFKTPVNGTYSEDYNLEYRSAGVYKKRGFIFTEDTKISIEQPKEMPYTEAIARNEHVMVTDKNNKVKDTAEDVFINMGGKNLDVSIENTHDTVIEKDFDAVYAEAGRIAITEAGNVNLSSKNKKGGSNGIHSVGKDESTSMVTISGTTNIDAKTGIKAEGGTVRINAGTVNSETFAQVGGNSIVSIGSVKETPAVWNGNWKQTGGQSDLSLTGSQSSWAGFADVSGGKMGLRIVDEAVWKNTGNSHLTELYGGVTKEEQGVIDQSGAKDLTVDSYSGHTTIIYKQQFENKTERDAGNDIRIIGGNVIITSAEKGSHITLLTDREGISNEKLREQEVVEAIFNKMANKLYYTNYKTEQNLEGHLKIAEGLTAQSAEKVTGEITFTGNDGQGQYKKDSANPELYPGMQQTETFTVPMTGSEEKDIPYRRGGVMKVADTGDITYSFTKEKTNIVLKTSEETAVSAKEKDYTVDMNGNSLHIVNDGQNGITADGKKITFRNGKGTTIAAKETGIEVKNGGAFETVKGGAFDVTAETAFKAEGDNSTLSVGAGAIKSSVLAEASDGGHIMLYVPNDRTKSQYTGDVNIRDKKSKVVLGVATEGSTWVGAVNNNGGHFELGLQNGGLWENTGKKEADITLLDATDTGRGVIHQKKESGKIHIGTFKGSAMVLYGHNASDPTDIQGGDITIENAGQGSMIILRTDRSGIHMGSYETVEAVLDALAHKLIYEGYKDGENNLKGQVEIAEGLTAQSAAKQMGMVEYDKLTGKGQYKKGSMTPGKKDGEIIWGNMETMMMRGAKNAMTTSMLSFRNDMTAMTQRLGEIREGTANGIWARTYGGKVNYEKGTTNYKENFWGTQVGVDKKQKNGWHTGVSFDYLDGSATYELGGKGDPKLYTLSIYGTKIEDNGEYIDIVGKAGRTQNEYTVYNDFHQLKGDYKTYGYGISAEYGKRIENGNTYLTPQIQLSYMKLQGTDYDAVSDYANGKKMHVEQDGMTSLVGRIGIAAGKRTETTDLYLKASLLHEFKGATASTFSAENEPTATVDQDFGDTWAELTLGGSHGINKDKIIYADITKSFGGDYEMEWKANAGIRLRF